MEDSLGYFESEVDKTKALPTCFPFMKILEIGKQMKAFLIFTLLLSNGLVGCQAQNKETEHLVSDSKQDAAYRHKTGDPNGTGKWYMGREIAHVMGYQGINWLERQEREKEEQTSLLLKNMQIKAEDAIADIGAGSGYHVFKMAALAKEGSIYAVDIQEEMLAAIKKKQADLNLQNLKRIKGSEQSTNLPAHSIDKVLMVDVYHEFSYPQEMLKSIFQALKKDGKVYLIEYRMEDDSVPIKTIHKMTEQQAVKEFEANGFELLENIDNLPWQHCMVFEKL